MSNNAQTMAATQRDISVSEFFAKNRHLLGFDNPHKAMLTTVKEAVDNSLDACEEAGILPEIWVEITPTTNSRYTISIQDNGPGITKAQIPPIFGKLLYGSKFHRLRQSRGQQGIGISAAGMYGMLTTGKPVKITTKTAQNRPTHYHEILIDTRTNHPEILKSQTIDPGSKGQHYLNQQRINWTPHYPNGQQVTSGTRVTIELEAKYSRRKGGIDEYLLQTAISNPHLTLHYIDPNGELKTYARTTPQLPPEAKEIKPHPYGTELGQLLTMLKDTKAHTTPEFLAKSFSRISTQLAKSICSKVEIPLNINPHKIDRHHIENLHKTLQTTKISTSSTDCIHPIGEELLLKSLHQTIPGEFYCATTRPPAIYRGNPFLIEIALAYGGSITAHKVPVETLTELLAESDSRTVRQFLASAFEGIGLTSADKILEKIDLARKTPSKLDSYEITKLHNAMNISITDGQMRIMRYANRVPLQFQAASCAITQAITSMNWRHYGLSQSRGSLPVGPITIIAHMASVWVPYTSESKEAIAPYPEIQKELRLALQIVGRKLGTYLNIKKKMKMEGERRTIFTRYLSLVATAVSEMAEVNREDLYKKLLIIAKQKTAEADMKLNDRGKKIVV